MLNMLWAGMMAAGIFWAAFHGNMGEVTNGLLDSAKRGGDSGSHNAWDHVILVRDLKDRERAGLIEALTERCVR